MALLCGYKMLINYNVFKGLLIQGGKIRKLDYSFSRHRRLNYVKCLAGCARIEKMLATARAVVPPSVFVQSCGKADFVRITPYIFVEQRQLSESQD